MKLSTSTSFFKCEVGANKLDEVCKRASVPIIDNYDILRKFNCTMTNIAIFLNLRKQGKGLKLLESYFHLRKYCQMFLLLQPIWIWMWIMDSNWSNVRASIQTFLHNQLLLKSKAQTADGIGVTPFIGTKFLAKSKEIDSFGIYHITIINILKLNTIVEVLNFEITF